MFCHQWEWVRVCVCVSGSATFRLLYCIGVGCVVVYVALSYGLIFWLNFHWFRHIITGTSIPIPLFSVWRIHSLRVRTMHTHSYFRSLLFTLFNYCTTLQRSIVGCPAVYIYFPFATVEKGRVLKATMRLFCRCTRFCILCICIVLRCRFDLRSCSLYYSSFFFVGWVSGKCVHLYNVHSCVLSGRWY